jgi:hypothetical protein
MKIRTRLMLCLLPTLIGSIALVVTLLSFRLHDEILDGFKTQLRSAAISTAAAFPKEEKDLEGIGKKLGLASLSFIPLDRELPKDPLYDAQLGLANLEDHQSNPSSMDRSSAILMQYGSRPDSSNLSHSEALQNSPNLTARRITETAAVYDVEGHQIGHIAASGPVDSMHKKFRESLLLVLFSGSCAILLLVATLYLIAGRIALPMQKLNNSALAIAAGHYGESAPIGGPKEVADLANTLNTMSECLLENIDRLKENALFRERMYGEYECAMLLQHMMLQKNIDECNSDAVAVKSFTLFSDSPRGLLLDFPTKAEKNNLFYIHMAEAEDTGFEGMYELLTQYKYSREIAKHTALTFDRDSSILQSQGPHLPLFWSLDGKKFIETQSSEVALKSGDFFFLFNDGLKQFLKEERRAIQDILMKVLKIFAQDGLETTFSMLQKELTFAAKRKELSEDIHLLCFQVLNP